MAPSDEQAVTELTGTGAPSPKSAPRVRIVLRDGQENRTVVLVKHSTRIGKLLAAFCQERSVDPREHRLIHHGKVLQEAEEISSYNIQDNDVIEVVASQTGGGRGE